MTILRLNAIMLVDGSAPESQVTSAPIKDEGILLDRLATLTPDNHVLGKADLASPAARWSEWWL